MEGVRYAFIAEWYDSLAGMVRRYNFLFYPKDNTVEMIDLKNKRVFLKRTRDEKVLVDQLYIGSSLNVLGRQLKLVEFADNFTKTQFESAKEKTLAIIKPDAMPKMPLLLEEICGRGFQICEAATVQLTRPEAEEFYSEHRDKPFFSGLVSFMTEGPIMAVELLADNAVGIWRKTIGPTNSAEARSQAPDSLRARFGTDQTRNACHGSDSVSSANREIDFFFGKSKSRRRSPAKTDNASLCLIKPHAVMKGLTGRIARAVVEGGFDITALQLFHLEKANTEEFLEVYKTVVPEYLEMVSELCSGPCVAMAVTHRDGSCVEQFRQLVGPMDPEIARHLRPHTLRAKFGIDKLKNGIHCTDLADDGALEVEYFFSILRAI